MWRQVENFCILFCVDEWIYQDRVYLRARVIWDGAGCQQLGRVEYFMWTLFYKGVWEVGGLVFLYWGFDFEGFFLFYYFKIFYDFVNMEF